MTKSLQSKSESKLNTQNGPYPMRILMIAPQPFYIERGTPINIKLLCKVLGEAGHRVDLLAFPTGKNVNLKNLRIIRLPNLFRVKAISPGPSIIKLAYDIPLTLTAFFLVMINKYDVIHGIEEGGFLAVFLAKLFGLSSIFDMDSCMSEQLKYSSFIKNRLLLGFVVYIEKWCIKNSSCVITVCHALTEKAKSLYPEGNICQIEDIPLTSSSESKNMTVDNIVKENGLKGKIIILYTGNLEPYQGIDLLLHAWKQFLAGNSNAVDYRLVIVGGTNTQIQRYNNLASVQGIDGTVCWIGQRPSEEMGEWMHLAHLLVSPRSEGDNTPLKLYSYMSSGRPIVATKRITHTQILDNSMAFLAEPDSGEFSEAISTALHDSELAIQKAKKAKKVLNANYNYQAFRRKLLKAYARLV